MESSQIFGGAEECNSCESGWTMYIGSPIPGDDDDDDDDGHGDAADDSKCRDYDDDGDGINYNHEDGSDDSMASDASSGPSNQGISHFRLGGDKIESKYNPEKKASKPMDKQKAESRRKNEKEKKMVMAKRSTTASAQNDSKERMGNWLGKRK